MRLRKIPADPGRCWLALFLVPALVLSGGELLPELARLTPYAHWWEAPLRLAGRLRPELGLALDGGQCPPDPAGPAAVVLRRLGPVR